MFDSIFRNSIRDFTIESDPKKASTLGIALSGGGNRAVAFHLGCFRALNDMGLLNKVDHISSVSGGSLFSALYCYYNDPFESFENRVTELLRKGLQLTIARKLFLGPLFLNMVATHIISGTAAIASRILKSNPPLSRWYSRTNAFIEVLDQNLFSGLTLQSKRRNDIDVIINACELSTGTAFRFGSTESGSWRIGRIQDNNVSLSEAVACSAAYPIFLPTLDKKFMFVKKQTAQERRVFLSDGGVYDNSGLTCFDPDKDSSYSFNVFKPQNIFAFDAGHGIYGKPSFPYYFKSRVERSYDTTFRKNQDGNKYKLHNQLASGKIESFIYSYLGQNDRSLPYIPSGFITYNQVTGYPTDFKAMTEKNIQLIAGRGEQLTRLLISHYNPIL